MDYSIAIFRFWGDFCYVEPDFQAPVFTRSFFAFFRNVCWQNTMSFMDF